MILILYALHIKLLRLYFESLKVLDLKLKALKYYPLLTPSPLFEQYVQIPKKDTLGFDNIYLINLGRRPDRKQKMNWAFDLLGLKVEYFEAFDGSKMNSTYLNNLGVKQLDTYKDPFGKRDMTFGEIGCFLSHYYIWEDVIRNNYEQVSPYLLYLTYSDELCFFIFNSYDLLS